MTPIDKAYLFLLSALIASVWAAVESFAVFAAPVARSFF